VWLENMTNTRARTWLGILLAAALTGPAAVVPASAAPLTDQGTIYVAEWSRLRHLAEEGDANAQFQLGNLYYTGRARPAIPQNYKKAYEFFLQAARQGHAAAQHNVAVLFLRGQGVPQDGDKAAAWFMLAAAHGSRSAAKVVARLQAELEPQRYRKIEGLKRRLAEDMLAREKRLNLAE
jgi:TPR repeat protein